MVLGPPSKYVTTTESSESRVETCYRYEGGDMPYFIV